MIHIGKDVIIFCPNSGFGDIMVMAPSVAIDK
jgi:hypothetical protein